MDATRRAFSMATAACEASAVKSSSSRSPNGSTTRSVCSLDVISKSKLGLRLISWMTPMTSPATFFIATQICDFVR